MGSGKHYSAADMARAEAMWRDGVTVSEIADALGRSEMAIKVLACNHRDRFPRRVPEVTTRTVAEMRRLRAQGHSLSVIGGLVGTCSTTVGNYVRDMDEED